MSFVLQYPGSSRLDAVAGRIEIVGTSPSVETATSILDDLVSAWNAGLNFNGTIQAIQLFTRVAGYATPSPAMAVNAGHNPSTDVCRLAERSLAVARNTWLPLIGMLGSHDAIAAWQAVDGLFASIISGHLHEDVIAAGFRNMETAQYPQSATAAFIARRLLALGILDSRLVDLVEYLRLNARFPQEMALVAATSSRLDYQILAQSLKRSGSWLEALSAIRTLDETVSDTFGGDFFVDVEGGDNRQAGELLSKQALATRAEWNINDPFLDNYVEYVIGRIEAGAGNPDHARRIFENTYRAGFGPFDSTVYVAYLATSTGDLDAARAAVERLVTEHAIPASFTEGFGQATNAYRRAGGETARLERIFPMERLVDECRRNRSGIDTAFEEKFEADRAPALDRFWRGKAENLLYGLGKVLQPSDFDNSRSGAGRTIRLPEVLLVKSCVDQLPGLSPIARQVFFEAGRGGAPVDEVTSQILEVVEFFKLDFTAMSRMVPAWAFSSSVAVERLESAIKQHDEAAVDNVLDQYIKLDGVPSGLLAELYGRVTGGDCCLVNREKVLLMGVRLWKASRGGSGARILKTLRQMSMDLLADLGARGLWITAVDAILDTIPDDDTRKTLCDWFLEAADRESGPRADPMLLNAGMVLARRIGTPFDETVRARMRDLVLAGDKREPETLKAADLSGRIVRLNQWCEGDPEADRLISDWFHRWVRAQGMKAPANWEAITDVANLAISRTGDDESRLAVAATALRVLTARLGQAGSRNRVIARIESLSEVLPDASTTVAAWRERQRNTRIRLSVWIGVGAVLACVSILLGWLYAC